MTKTSYSYKTIKELPNEERPYKFVIDADPIAYRGSSAVEKTIYKWINNTTGEISPDLYSAEEANDWITTECWMSKPDEQGWERISRKDIGTEEDAKEATISVVKDYVKTCEVFGRKGVELQFKGFLTKSGLKNKDVKGLEKEYQHNRKDNGIEKPIHLEYCRNYLLNNYDWVNMAKEGFEADTHVITFAERYGYDGCLLSIDKDLHQVEGSWYINTYENLTERNMIKASVVGDLWQETNSKGKIKYVGNGFKWLCYQAVAGDSSDGFTGLPRASLKKLYELLSEAKTKEECVANVKALYENRFKLGYLDKALKEDGEELEKDIYKYKSWDGVKYSPTIEEIMQQHFFLAYQERSSTDIFNIYDYLK